MVLRGHSWLVRGHSWSFVVICGQSSSFAVIRGTNLWEPLPQATPSKDGGHGAGVREGLAVLRAGDVARGVQEVERDAHLGAGALAARRGTASAAAGGNLTGSFGIRLEDGAANTTGQWGHGGLRG